MKNKLSKKPKKTIEFGTWEAIQPIKGKNDSGFSKGSRWMIHEPWSLGRFDGKDHWENKPYLIVQKKEIVDNGGGPASVFPYGSDTFNLFLKIKKNKNWFIKL